jgi:hypothetical protein
MGAAAKLRVIEALGTNSQCNHYPDESGFEGPDSLHFFQIFKEQPNKLTAKRNRSIPLNGKPA